MSYWREYIDDLGQSVYEERVVEYFSDLPESEDGVEFLVLYNKWLPTPKLSGLYQKQSGDWVRTMSLSDLGKAEKEPPQEEQS